MNALADCKALVDSYAAWLRSGIKSIPLDGGACVIEVPFLDRHNDHIQIIVETVPDGLKLTDDGFTLDDLAMSGVDISTQKRVEILDTTLARLGVRREGEALTVLASSVDFPAKKHALIQAIMAVGDMFYLSREHVRSFFKEDVSAYLQENDLNAVGDVKITGKSGYAHAFDFVIAATRETPERLIRAINNPNRSSVVEYCFVWEDTRTARSQSARAFAILNDVDNRVDPGDLSALRNYGIIPLQWQHRNDIAEALRRVA